MFQCSVSFPPLPHPPDPPELTQLLNFPGKMLSINVAREIGVKYQVVGTALLHDRTGVIIPAIVETCQGNVERITIEILRRWIQGDGVEDRSWRKLIGVLKSSDCEALAGDLLEVLCSHPDSLSSCELRSPAANLLCKHYTYQYYMKLFPLLCH